MTIYSTASNPNPMTFTELSVKLQTTSVSIPTPPTPIDFCFCDYNCDYVQLVLAGSDEYQTDKSDFPIQVPGGTPGTFNIYIQNIVTGVETIMTDNTYGTYFTLGYVATNADKGGYLIDWGKVRDTLGYGRYKIRIERTFFGQTQETTSHEYRLLPYSPELANGTVKVEMTKNGCIENGFDYRGLNWVSSVRFKGRFYQIDQAKESEFYTNTNWKAKKIQEVLTNRYALECRELPSQIFEPLKDDGFRATNLFITDYNLLSYEDLRQVEVVNADVTEFGPRAGSRRGKFIVEFDYVQSKVSRV